MLMKAVEEYLAVRRASGFELEVPAYLLRSFARFCTERGEKHVSTRTVIAWASQAPSLSQRDHRLKTVRRFAIHAHVEDALHEIPPRDVFGYTKRRRLPYVYSDSEIHQILRAASQLGPPGSSRPHTYHTLFALLITTGLRISEALSLCLDDITSDGLVIRETKFKKSRLVPLHETALAGLDRYLERRRKFAAPNPYLFVSIRGQILDRSSVHWTFRRILQTIGLDPAPSGRRPRIHDMRHGFAIRVLEKSPEGREEIGRHMLALSTYMGHSNVADTYWYLEATPHLLRDISRACEAFFQKGGRS